MQVWAGEFAGASQSGGSTNAHSSATPSEEESRSKGSSPGPESSWRGQGSSGNRLVDIARSDPVLAQKLEIPGVMQALDQVGLQNPCQIKSKSIMSNQRNCVERIQAIIHRQAAMWSCIMARRPKCDISSQDFQIRHSGTRSFTKI